MDGTRCINGDMNGQIGSSSSDASGCPEVPICSSESHVYANAEVRLPNFCNDWYNDSPDQRRGSHDSETEDEDSRNNYDNNIASPESVRIKQPMNGFIPRRNYGATGETRRRTLSERIEDDFARSSFYSSKRVRHSSERNAKTEYIECELSMLDDAFDMNIESLNFDSEWKLELEQQRKHAKKRRKELEDVEPKKAGFLRCTTGYLRSCVRESTELYRMFVCSLIGVLVALLAALLLFITDRIVYEKHRLFARFTELATSHPSMFGLVIPGWMALNVLIATFGSILVFLIEPRVGGSGVPELRSFINGVSVPRVARCRSLAGRLLGLVVTPAADLPLGGKEPLLYVGGAVAAGVSQGRASSFALDCNVFKQFRTHAEKRDFVTAGAAAGFCAGFGTPVSAVLFMMEQMSTFWTQAGVWRVMWTSIVASVTVTFISEFWRPEEAGIGSPMFGIIADPYVPMTDVWLAAFVGVLGGVFGVLFSLLNRAVNRLRRRYTSRGFRVGEVMLLSVACVCVCIPMLWFEGREHCLRLHPGNMVNPVGVQCPAGQTNSLGMLILQLPSKAFRSLVHEPAGIFHPLSLMLFAGYSLAASALLYGCNLSGGVIMPNFVIGATWGRLLGLGLIRAFGPSAVLSVEKLAVMGAAAQTAGVLRVVVTIPVMFVEATQSIRIGVVLAVAVVAAKITADFLYPIDFYTMWTRLLHIPYLPMEPDDSPRHLIALERLRAYDVMSRPVTYVRCTETVGNLLDILRCTPHNGFPVVSSEADEFMFGRLRGFVDRTTLLALLEHKTLYSQNRLVQPSELDADTFRRPRAPTLEEIRLSISEEELHRRVVVADHMSIAPHVVQSHMGYSRVYHMFRTLGLRHLPVVTAKNDVVGIITRKDLLRYRWSSSLLSRCRDEPGELRECRFMEARSDSE